MPSRGERSIPELFGDAMSQLAKLIGNEFALARTELSEKASDAGRAAAFIGAGAILMIPAIVVLLFAAAAALIRTGFSDPVAYLCAGGVAVAEPAMPGDPGAAAAEQDCYLLPYTDRDERQPHCTGIPKASASPRPHRFWPIDAWQPPRRRDEWLVILPRGGPLLLTPVDPSALRGDTGGARPARCPLHRRPAYSRCAGAQRREEPARGSALLGLFQKLPLVRPTRS